MIIRYTRIIGKTHLSGIGRIGVQNIVALLIHFTDLITFVINRAEIIEKTYLEIDSILRFK